MEQAVLFLITLIFAALGGLLGHKLKLPVGGLVGAMMATIVFHLFFVPALDVPHGMQLVLQIPLGAMIGSRVTREDVLSLKTLIKPVVTIVSVMLVCNLAIGAFLFRVSNLNAATSFFAVAPGGMVDMAIIAADFGANAAYVALLQLVRNVLVIVLILPVYRYAMKKMGVRAQRDVPDKNFTEEAVSIAPKGIAELQRVGETLFFSGAFGMLLWVLRVPAGAVIGAMIGAGAYGVVTGRARFPQGLRLPLQILAGFFIGVRMDRESLFMMGELLLPLVIVLIYVCLVTFVTAYFVHKWTGLDLPMSLLASTPGGMVEMAMLADELGVEAPKVTVIHTARLISVILFFPLILAYVVQRIG